MIGRLEDPIPPAVAKTTLYRAAGWLLRVYVISLGIVGVYSLLWLLEVAGMLPGRWLSTVWICIAAMGSIFLVLLIPLYFAARSTDR